jgi:hypothetical protein
MNSPLETGLFLPIRFYTSLEEQNRYKRTSTGVALVDETYIYVDCVALAPFQIILEQFCDTGIVSAVITLICTDNNAETALPYTESCWELWFDYTNRRTYLSYLGTDDFSAYTYNGRYYIKLDVVDMCEYTTTYYSDIFVIRNCAVPYDLNEYRATSQNINDKRLIDTSNLRITKT